MIHKQQKQKNNLDKGEEKKSSPSDLKPKLQRRCVACGKLFERKNLIRILAENKTKEIIINPDNKVFGRSVYICPKEECLRAALKKNRLERGLRVKFNENLSEKLKLMLN